MGEGKEVMRGERKGKKGVRREWRRERKEYEENGEGKRRNKREWRRIHKN